jgi:AAA domain-containing protein
MYLTRFHIENIRAIRELTWEVPLKSAPGWHVILGDNGSGKSSVLRSIALCLVGPVEAMALRQEWAKWLRHGEDMGDILLVLNGDPKFDKLRGRERSPAARVSVELNIFNEEDGVHLRLHPERHRVSSFRHLWGAGSGWFSASYGPFRRFTGGDEDYEKLFSTNPRLARHLSVFDESVALTEGLRWLQRLQFKKLEGDPEGARSAA